jgi:histidinol phosphatase-like PHP family hydrolase
MLHITSDLHLHTQLSSCATPEATLENYVPVLKATGIRRVAVTDHLWDDDPQYARRWYLPQNYEHILQNKERIAAVDAQGIEFLFGAEAEYNYALRRPAVTEEHAEQMDVLLVPNSHTHLAMPKDFYEPYEKHAQFMVDAFLDIVNSPVGKYVTAIPHPFSAVCCPYDRNLLLSLISDDQFKRCFDAAAEKGIALEINPNMFALSANRPLEAIYNDPFVRMYRIAKACGCRFTFGADAHNASSHANFHMAYVLAAILDIQQEDLHPLAR